MDHLICLIMKNDNKISKKFTTCKPTVIKKLIKKTLIFIYIIHVGRLKLYILVLINST